jgi:hypothetical protein
MENISFEVLSKPSNTIRTFYRTVNVAGSSYEMTLVTMKRSFLLVLDNVEGNFLMRNQNEDVMSREMLIQSFMSDNSSLKGLSLAIGGHNTCLIASENSVASLSLASRLSKSLNNNGPVYVANNLQMPDETLDRVDGISNLYDKIFQFVRQNYIL